MNLDLRAQLDQGLQSLGYETERTQDNPEAFGSWYRDYKRGERQLRLIWDGRDGWFVLQGGIPFQDLAIKRPAELVSDSAVADFLAHAI